MSSPKEDVLSPDELRKRLYQTFKNKGMLDTLKAQLRNKLIQELKPPHLTGQEPVPRALPVGSEHALLTACNSLVADHLRASGFEYTLSVFCPESGLSKDKIYMKDDLLQLLKVSHSPAFYKSVVVNGENEEKGLLFSFLRKLSHHDTQSFHQDVDTQTTHSWTHRESLVEKMKMIDREYERFSRDEMFSFQSKLAAHRKEIEAQMETEMNTKLQHFKEVEIAKVKMEEKSKFHKELEKLKQELQSMYEMKSRALAEREKHVFERLQKQQEIEEKNVYMQRQSVLKEIEILRKSENELRMKTEAFENTCKVHAEKVKTSEELFRRRELAIKTMEDTYDQTLKNELHRYQLELDEEFIKRTKRLTEHENRNKVEMARIQKETDLIDARLEELNRARSELKRLQVELGTAQQQISVLVQQKELLQERLDGTSDYSNLKREKVELLGQKQLLKKQLEEAKEENRQLHAEMIKPSKEELALQVELQRLQNAHKLDKEEFESQNQMLQTQLQAEVERCAKLKAQLRDCEERSQWATRHVEDIKAQLCQTQQALENEVLRNPKPSLVDRSTLELSADKLVPPDIYVDRALLSAGAGYAHVCDGGGSSRAHQSAWSDSQDSSTELVAEAKAHIQQLQKEAESLEEAYRKYQQRAVHSTFSQRQIAPQKICLSHYSPSSPLNKPGPQYSHFYSALGPRSPQRVGSHSFRNAPSQQDQHRSTLSFAHSSQSVANGTGLRSQEEGTLPHSTRPKPHKESSEAVSPVVLPDRTFPEEAPISDISPELSPPQSPQLQSTAREQASPTEGGPAFSSSESSPKPEKINLEDLKGIQTEPDHIPELLLDTAVPLSEEAPGPVTPHPQDLPEDPAKPCDQAELQWTSGKSANVEKEELEEQKWERERKERQERRQRELEEAKEREWLELGRLEIEVQDEEQPKQKEEDVKEEQEEGPKSENPLEKYVKMVLEAREKQQAQSSVEEEEDGHLMSPAEEEKDESITAYSPKEDDDNFW